MIIALLILAFAATGLTQLLSLAAAQRRTSETRRLALEEVANQAERIALLTWDDASSDKLSQLAAGEALVRVAPSAKLTVNSIEDPGPPAARRIRLEVTWTTSDGQAVEPLGLTVWKHQPAEVQP